MKKISAWVLALLLLGGISVRSEKLKFEEKEEIQKTLEFADPSKAGEVQVDNILGSITLEGTEAADVRLFVKKTIKARTEDRIQKAKDEVELEIKTEGNLIDLFVDGPFRCKDDRKKGKEWRDPGYEVHFDFDIKVPRRCDITLKTVTSGDIVVKNIEGVFEVHNVNGKITMNHIAGDGEAHTVNGWVKVDFTRNPVSECSFKTINGDIEIGFQDGLAADFRLKTFNGDALSDFPVSYLPGRAATEKKEKGRYVYKSDRFVGVKVGKGGPEIKMDTLNGDLLITKTKNRKENLS